LPISEEEEEEEETRTGHLKQKQTIMFYTISIQEQFNKGKR
jgi:hypothetical protein